MSPDRKEDYWILRLKNNKALFILSIGGRTAYNVEYKVFGIV